MPRCPPRYSGKLMYFLYLLTMACISITIWEMTRNTFCPNCRFLRGRRRSPGLADLIGHPKFPGFEDQVEPEKLIDHKPSGSDSPKVNLEPTKKNGKAKESPKLEKAATNFLPIYVFEEHHEAVHYWFGGVQSGLVPKRSGNTLIHIDGHSDLGPPITSGKFPFSMWPQFPDVARLMMGNDRFIIGSASTGLFSRIIWIWPSWDEEGNRELFYGDATMWSISIGSWMRPVLSESGDSIVSHVEEFCACGMAIDPPKYWNKTMRGKHCHRYNSSEPNEMYEEEDIECQQTSKFIIETYHEEEIIKRTQLGGAFPPISNTDGFILDIDEDFFGCGAVVEALYDAEVEESFVRGVSDLVSALFCGKTIEHERVIDLVFGKLTEYVKNHRGLCRSLRKLGRRSVDFLSHQCLSQAHKEIEKVTWEEQIVKETSFFNNIMCKREEEKEADNKMVLANLLLQLSFLNDHQLSVLAEIGVCFAISPNTDNSQNVGHFRVCDGYNRPNSTLVTFFTPSKEEVTARAERLQTILTQLGMRPDLVTVCRSVRDGYTPRSRFRQIEDLVLELLQEQYSPAGDVNVFYDRDLLGGRQGWPGRRGRM